MYIGDPSIVLAMCSPGFNPLQNPKSPNFTFPLAKNMFSGLISLCIILNLLSTLNASNSCLKIVKALFSVKWPSFLIASRRVPPLQY